jgi:hypothetical protein
MHAGLIPSSHMPFLTRMEKYKHNRYDYAIHYLFSLKKRLANKKNCPHLFMKGQMRTQSITVDLHTLQSKSTRKVEETNHAMPVYTFNTK